MIKKIFTYFEGINGLIAALYITVLFVLRALTVDTYNIWVIVLMSIAIFGLMLALCPKIFGGIRKLTLPSEFPTYTVKEKRIWTGIFFFVNFVFWLIRYLSIYPGGFVIDSINQYTQVVNNSYNDWHPALHTFLFFTVPYKITGQVGSIVFMQIFYLSLALTYAESVLMKYAGKIYAVIAMFFLLLNPAIHSLAVIPTKDIAFSISSMVLMTYVLHIYFTKGKWINKWSNLIAFAVFAVLATIFRHNAILFILPLCVAVMFYIEKKQIIKFISIFLLLFFLIKVPLYAAIGVQKAEKRSVEMAGLPMTIISNVVKENPDAMDEELKEFVYSIAPQESWNSYQCGNFNSVKWGKEGKVFNLEVLDDVGIVNICRLAGKSIILEPRASLQAMAVLFNRVVGIDGEIDWHPYTETADNEVGLEKYKGGMIDDFFLAYADIIRASVFKYLFYFTGIINLIIIVMIFAKMKFKTDWKKMLLCIPLVIHNLGTMLLLSGIDFRFFIVSFFVFPSILLIMLKQNDNV